MKAIVISSSPYEINLNPAHIIYTYPTTGWKDGIKTITITALLINGERVMLPKESAILYENLRISDEL